MTYVSDGSASWDATPAPGRTDAIVVTELPSGPGDGDGLFGHVLGVYEQHGYEAGYRRAVRDMLVGLLATTEQYLREQSPPPSSATAQDLRRVARAFELYLERRADRGPAGPGFVEGGLGI